MASRRQIASNIANNEAAAATRLSRATVSIINFTDEARRAIRDALDEIYGLIPDGADPVAWYAANRRGTVASVLNRAETQMLDVYRRRDDWLGGVTRDEYNISRQEQGWVTTNMVGLDLNTNRTTDAQRIAAWTTSNNKLANSQALAITRTGQVSRVQQIIADGMERGESLQSVVKALDVEFGFRQKKTGPLTPMASKAMREGKLVIRNGHIYNSYRVARTETHRIRSAAEVDNMMMSRDAGVDMRLQKVSVLDDRTRDQSARMDGQISNLQGQFLYPDGIYYHMGDQPAQWAINDRGSTIPVMGELQPDVRRERDLASGQGELVNYKDFSTYAREQGITENRYGEVYTGL